MISTRSSVSQNSVRTKLMPTHSDAFCQCAHSVMYILTNVSTGGKEKNVSREAVMPQERLGECVCSNGLTFLFIL